MEKFSNKEAIKFGWEKMKANFWFFVGAILTTFAITLIINMIIPILGSLIGMFLSLGLYLIALTIHDGGKPKFTDLFSGFKFFLKYLGALIILGLIIGIGIGIIALTIILTIGASVSFALAAKSSLISLVPIPALLVVIAVGIIGLYVSIRLQFFGWLIIDKNLGPIKSLRESFKLTKGVVGKLFGFGIVLGLINILGALALGIGLLATTPIALVGTAYVYRKLSSNMGATISAQPTPSTVA